MTRYTLEQREQQLRLHRQYARNMLNAYKAQESDPDANDLTKRFSRSAIIIYQDVLDHIDEIFGKDEDQ